MSEHYPTCARAAFGEPPPCSCPPGWPQETSMREPVKCSCWLGTGATAGSSDAREACTVHGLKADPPQPAWTETHRQALEKFPLAKYFVEQHPTIQPSDSWAIEAVALYRLAAELFRRDPPSAPLEAGLDFAINSLRGYLEPEVPGSDQPDRGLKFAVQRLQIARDQLSPHSAPPPPARLTVETLEAFLKTRNLERTLGAVVHIGQDVTDGRFNDGYCYAIAEVFDIFEGRLIVHPLSAPEKL